MGNERVIHAPFELGELRKIQSAGLAQMGEIRD
jgi:hypothetical protein